MRITVVCVNSLQTLTPVMNLISCLLDLGHTVTLLARNPEELPAAILQNPSFSFVDIGPKRNGLVRIHADVAKTRLFINRYLKEHSSEIDVIWTTTDTSARDSGRQLLKMRHVMQLMELTEGVPFITYNRHMPKSRAFIEYARNAKAVVVPEINRAYIQKIWWKLDRLPVVLPNKPIIETPEEHFSEDEQKIADLFAEEKRSIVLYQGNFYGDRNFKPVADGIDLLGGSHALYLMGKATPHTQPLLDELTGTHQNVRYVGYVNPPNHLLFTKMGHIGLLPYSPFSDSTPTSSLNALYCAPNKIWEYARFGLPSLSSSSPALDTIFARYNMGAMYDDTKPDTVAKAIEEIEDNYEQMSIGAKKYYDDTDMYEIIESILTMAMED